MLQRILQVPFVAFHRTNNFFYVWSKMPPFYSPFTASHSPPQEINRLDASCTQKGVNIPMSAARLAKINMTNPDRDVNIVS